MAFDFSKLNILNFFNKLDARARVFFLLGGVIGVILLIYLGTVYLWGDTRTTGPSQVASAPKIQSIPGAELNPEYKRALLQKDVQNVERAQASGGTSIPTFINTGMGQASSSGCVVCADQSANVKDDLENWVSQGKISPEVASSLEDLASKNVPISEYAAELDRLVREGKLTPEQARLLLEKYKKQHANNLLDESGKLMDGMIKSGALSLDAANDLLDAQKRGVSPSDYSAELQRLVAEGKLSPTVAQQLLAQYTQQRAKEVTAQSIASLKKMASGGQLTPEVLNQLVDLESKMVPIDLYSNTLNKLVSDNKITPAVSKKILDEFRAQKAAIGPTGSLNQMIQDAENALYTELNDLLREKKISQDVAAYIASLVPKNISLDDFTAAMNQLVQQNKLTPDIAKLKIADYRLIKGLRDEAARLNNLQANNVPPDTYADELKKAVQAGLITPDQAKQLLQEYLAMLSKTPTTMVTGAENADFARLQERTMQSGVGTELQATQFEAAQTTGQQETDQDRMNRIQNMINAMNGQAQQLVSAWQPPTQQKTGSFGPDADKDKDKDKDKNGGGSDSSSTQKGGGGTDSTASKGRALIKAGTILFAVLDTAANSDFPDSPVMATVVQGPYKGARLLGKLTTAKNAAGQLDRIGLNFTMMDMEAWDKHKNVNAYAIDPDTARSVMASDVDYHYIKRFGAIMATSFLQGYATSITNAGTSTTGIFGTSTTHPSLSPASKIAVGLGQVGQTLGATVQNYANIPPTVKVDSGVGLGILFMDEVNP